MTKAVNKLIEYLQIKTEQPEPDYDKVVKFLRAYANEIGFDSYKELEVEPGSIVCLMSYYGTSPDKKSILLNSHTDVVPVLQKYWKCDAFEGKIDENRDIYGRGTQDMKSVGIQHLELIRKMKENSIRPERSIHLTFVPDEEIGGTNGLAAFLETEDFNNLNVGLAFDEGQSSPTEEFCVYYGERVAWWIEVTCIGETGHGSRFIEKTAAEKLQIVINRFLDYREQQKLKLQNECLKLGEVTTINLNRLTGGLAVTNVVPPEFKAVFDVRLTPRITFSEFKSLLESWISEAEGDDKGSVTYEIKNRVCNFNLTPTNQSKWWKCFEETSKELNIKLSAEIFPCGTDLRFIREKGIPAFGFTPLNNTSILLHANNEFINENKFLEGIDILYKVVLNMANME